jgi:hypothetical protein
MTWRTEFRKRQSREPVRRPRLRRHGHRIRPPRTDRASSGRAVNTVIGVAETASGLASREELRQGIRGPRVAPSTPGARTPPGSTPCSRGRFPSTATIPGPRSAASCKSSGMKPIKGTCGWSPSRAGRLAGEAAGTLSLRNSPGAASDARCGRDDRAPLRAPLDCGQAGIAGRLDALEVELQRAAGATIHTS